ncbi:MAG: LysR family transcriptional regulator [Pseudomonadota bacterium]
MDLTRADLALLSSLRALLETRGVTAAARRMGISQPAMSAQLARLRDLFDDPLLVGNAHGMARTPVAEEILPELSAGIDALTRIVRERVPFDPALSDRTFSIASTDYIFSAVLISALRDMMREAPGVRFAMSLIGGSGTTIDTTDLLVATPTLSDSSAIRQVLYRESFVVVMRHGHPLADADLSPARFCDLEHILVSPRSASFAGPVDEVLETMGMQRRVSVSMPSFNLALKAVQSTDLVTVFPRRLALDNTEHVAIKPLPFDSPGFDVIATWHPKMKKDPGHLWLRKKVAELVRATVTNADA